MKYLFEQLMVTQYEPEEYSGGIYLGKNKFECVASGERIVIGNSTYWAGAFSRDCLFCKLVEILIYFI